MNACSAPLRCLKSIGFTPAARTAIRICPGPGCGSSMSATCRTSGPPYSSYTTAFISRAYGSDEFGFLVSSYMP
jgi:hypothetical protein